MRDGKTIRQHELNGIEWNEIASNDDDDDDVRMNEWMNELVHLLLCWSIQFCQF